MEKDLADLEDWKYKEDYIVDYSEVVEDTDNYDKENRKRYEED